MPFPIQTNPYGAAWQADDGSVVFLPPDVTPPWAVKQGPEGTPPFASTPPPPVVSEAAASPPPPPPPAAPVAPNHLDAAASIEDVKPVRESPKEPPTPPAPVPPLAGAGGPIPGEPPVPDIAAPFQQQADAALAAGELAYDAAQEQAQRQQQAAAEAAKIQAKRDEAAQKIAARHAELNDAYIKAAKEQSSYDIRTPQRSVGSQVGQLIAIALGGIGQALSRQGGPNPVLEILQRKAEAEAANRVRRYQQLGENVGNAKGQVDAIGQLAKNNDAYYQGQLAAVWDAYGKETERQGVLLGGEKALIDARRQAGEMYVKRDEAAAKAAQQTVENERADAKFALDRVQTVGNLDVAQQNARTSRINAGTSAGQLALDRVREKRVGEENARNFVYGVSKGITDRAFDAVNNANKPEAQRLAFDQEKELSARKPQEVPIVKRDAKGNIIGTDYAPLVQKDGKTPYLFPSDTEAPELRKKMGAAFAIRDIVNQILEIRDRVGGEAAIFNSDDRQRLVALQNALTIVKKGGTQGMSSDEDMKRIEDSIGASDVTSFRERSAGLIQGIKNTENELNTTLRANNYTGERIKLTATEELPGAKPNSDVRTAISESRATGPFGRIASQLPLEPGAALSPKGRSAIDAVAERVKAGDPNAPAMLGELLKDPMTSPYARAKAVKLGIDVSKLGAR